MVEFEKVFSVCKVKMDIFSFIFCEQRSDTLFILLVIGQNCYFYLGYCIDLIFDFFRIEYFLWSENVLIVFFVFYFVFGDGEWGNRREKSGKEKLCKYIRFFLFFKNSKLEIRDFYIKNVERCIDFCFLKGG